MRIEASNEQERLSFFQELYEEAKTVADDYLSRLDQHLEQYKGSTKIDNSNEDATVVRNITYELVESQVSSYIPNPSITPKVASEKNTRLAKSIETLCKNKRDELSFEMMNDLDERYNPIYGGSVWTVEWDDSIIAAHNAIGDLRVSCLAPKHFVGEPGIFDIKDMDYCFITYETTKEDLVRKYEVSYDDADETESVNNTAKDNSATVFICYYRDDDRKIGQFIWSGDKVLKDITDYYARKKRVCLTCGKREQLCTCEEDGNKPKIELVNDDYETLDAPVMRSDGTVIPIMSPEIDNGQIVYDTTTKEAVDQNGQMIFDSVGGVLMPKTIEVKVPRMTETQIPWYVPDVFPVVIRKNTSEEGSLFGQSDCEFIRPQQQAINKVESRIMMKLMRSSVTPVIPEDATVTINNSVFGNVIRMMPGQSVGQYGVVDTTPNITQDIAEAERLYDHAKRILGISASFQGQADTTAQSGKAKQLQIQQAAGRLDSKRQMKNAAYAEIDKIMFKLTLAYADEPRDYSYRDAFGRWQNISFNRYDFVEQDEDGKYFYNDEFLFAADASVDIDKSRDFIWQENSRLFQMGAFGDPASPEAQLIFWQNSEAAKYPFAHDNVERLKEVINAQRQAAMAQQQIADLSAQNQELTQEVANRTGYADYLYNTINGGQRT
jgi:hypothetical protein